MPRNRTLRGNLPHITIKESDGEITSPSVVIPSGEKIFYCEVDVSAWDPASVLTVIIETLVNSIWTPKAKAILTLNPVGYSRIGLVLDNVEVRAKFSLVGPDIQLVASVWSENIT